MARACCRADRSPSAVSSAWQTWGWLAVLSLPDEASELGAVLASVARFHALLGERNA
jgi:hypothetical protein